MKERLLTLLAVALATLGATAQPKSMRQPGQRMALPELRMSQSAADNSRRAPKTGQPVVAWAKGSQPHHALKTISDADNELFNGRTVYGAMVNSDQWANMSITQVPYGIYSFQMGSAEAPTAHITNMSYDFMSGAWGRDRHFGISVMNILGAINGARYITINTRDWQETRNTMWDTSHGTYSLVASTIAYDPTSDEFYAFQYKEDLSGLNWVRINQQTDQLEQLAQYRGQTSVLTLAAMPNGQMYYIDAAGDLYTVNKQTGRSSLVGNTGVTPSNYGQAMVYDGKSGAFLWAAQSAEGSVLYSVNPTTAETQRVMRFQHNEQFVSLYITDSEALPGAPAAVGRPQLKADSDGALQTTLTFNVPTRTYDGSTLAGNVNLNVWMDGENLKGEAVEPGTSVSMPITTTEGNHYIAITTDNSAGFSPMRYIYQYVGYDTPLPATNVVFVQQDGQNSISWKAPTAGINNGYIDAANLTYDIVRMPDSVAVATGVKALSFTEGTPQVMHSYSYRVIADNNGHKAKATESNRILCGSAFTVPYAQEFGDTTTLADYFTVVDRDGDGNTWRQGYTNEVRMDYMKKNDADDWLISPPISMESGIKYRFAMNMKIFTRNYPEDFEVLIGTDKDDLSTFKVLKREEGFTEIASEFADYTTDFLVEQTGEYHMAVRYCSKKNSQSSLMMINNFRVNAIGNSLAPAQPADMAVTPDVNDELKATITFTTPSRNLMDETLTSLTAVNIYRDSEESPIHTFTDAQPGQQLSFTDEQVPTVGLHTYTVRADNSAGQGEPLTVEQFVGIYTAPYSEDFENRKLAELWTSELNVTDDVNGWYGWQWKDNSGTYGRYMDLYYYLTTNTPTDIWLFTPRFKFEADAVYTVNMDAAVNYSYYPDMSYGLYQGTEANSAAMTTLISDMPSTNYSMTAQEYLLVNQDAGRYYLGIKAHGATAYDYFSADIDNFSLTYRTSAFAPYKMTGYQGKADATAALKATLTFKAPTTNYYQQALNAAEPLTIKIYHGQNATMPAQVVTALPGEQVTWTDEEALHGLNYYTITCENDYGSGETLRDTLFVGKDVPDVVADFAARGSADNKDAVITWSMPAMGVNGGVVLKEDTKYNVYEYDPSTGNLTPLAQEISTTSYTVEREAQTAQQMHYYAVAAVNSEGEGQALATSIVLGSVYNLPFHESFANSTLSTQLWQAIPMVQGATSAGLDNPTSGSYNQCTGPQDEDGGCAYIYNGYQYEVQAGALLVSPKVKLAAERGNKLHFWAYHFKESYSAPAFIQVAVSADDQSFNYIANAYIEVGGDSEEGWKEHVIDLDNYRSANFVSIAILGITSGYQDVIYLDNFSIVNGTSSGINDITDTATADHQPSFDLQGRRVDPKSYRGIIVQKGKKTLQP